MTRLLVLVPALGHLAVGLTMLFAPEWFHANLGQIGPFNRHYVAAAGAPLVALGLGLLAVSFRSRISYPLVTVAAAASWLHVLNHAFDVAGEPAADLGRWAVHLAPAAFSAVALTVGAIRAGEIVVRVRTPIRRPERY